MIFENVDFIADCRFDGVTFDEEARFAGTNIRHAATFEDVKYKENTVFKGLWNNVFYPAMSTLLSFFCMEIPKKKVTTFIGLNTAMMDGASNPYLKRHVEDEQWLRSWKRKGKFRGILFYFWELTSHCGRSFVLWMLWVLLAALIFGAIFADYPPCHGYPTQYKIFL